MKNNVTRKALHVLGTSKEYRINEALGVRCVLGSDDEAGLPSFPLLPHPTCPPQGIHSADVDLISLRGKLLWKSLPFF